MTYASDQLDFLTALGLEKRSAEQPRLWIGPPVRAACDEVLLAIAQGASVVVIAGDAGSGKTVLAKLIVHRCGEIGRQARLMARGDLVQPDMSRGNGVVVVDEADSIAASALRRLIPADSSAETKECFVFLCLPSSAHRFTFANPAMVTLRALSPVEAAEFLAEFSRRNGCDDLLAPEASDAIVEKTRGLPRLLDKVAGFAQFLATSDGEPQIGLKHATLALQAQMVGSQDFDGIAPPHATGASHAIEASEANRTAAEMQHHHDGSIGGANSTADGDDGAVSISPPLEASTIAVRLRQLAVVCVSAVIVCVASMMAASSLRTPGVESLATQQLRLSPVSPLPALEHVNPLTMRASLATVELHPVAPVVTANGESAVAASPSDTGEALLRSSNPSPRKAALSAKSQKRVATKLARKKTRATGNARRQIAQARAEEAQRAAASAAQAAKEARIANDQARDAQEAARLAAAQAEQVRQSAGAAQRVGQSLRTFFARTIDSMSSIGRSSDEVTQPTVFVIDGPDGAPSPKH